jgi:hypothetical protein
VRAPPPRLFLIVLVLSVVAYLIATIGALLGWFSG